MMNQRKGTQDQTLTTLISKDTKMTGKLKTTDNVRIDGHFKGGLEITGKLVTGEDSVVQGKASAIDIVIGGNFKGDIKAVWSVTLSSSAIVKGDIQTEELIIEQGAIFDGQCNMGHKVEGEERVESLALQEA